MKNCDPESIRDVKKSGDLLKSTHKNLSVGIMYSIVDC